MDIAITDREFGHFRGLLEKTAGITLGSAKKALVCGRLAKRLRHHQLKSFDAYYRLITSGREPGEMQLAIDLLTTNETYFFREPQHFELLRHTVLKTFGRGTSCRVWSAASSSGEEPYSLAMTLDDVLGPGAWELLGSDISMRMLEQAQQARYSMERSQGIPHNYLQRYCLKGIGSQTGTLMIERTLRNRVQFRQINLNQALPEIGMFDIVFLRNVLIYFDLEMKQHVIERIATRLKPGGWLFIGHSESLNGITTNLQQQQPTIYRKL